MARQGSDNINHNAHFYGAIYGFFIPGNLKSDAFPFVFQAIDLNFIFYYFCEKIKKQGMYPSASEILTAFTKNPDEGGKLLFERYYKPLVLFADSF